MGTEDEPVLLDRVRAAPAAGIAVIATGPDAERIRKICHAADLLVPIFAKTTIAHEAMRLVVVGEPSPPAPPRVAHVVRPAIGDDDLRHLLRALAGGAAIAGAASKVDRAGEKQALAATRPMLTANDAATIETAAIGGAVELVKADRAYFYWFDDASGALWRGGSPARQAFAGLVGWAARTGLPARVACAGDDARWLRELDDPDPDAKPQTRIMVQPVVGAERRVRAAIVAVRRWRHAPFSDDDGEVFAKFAELTAPLIDRAVPRGSVVPPPAPHEIAAEPSTRVKAASIPPVVRVKPPTPPPPERMKPPTGPPRTSRHGDTLPRPIAVRAPAMTASEAKLAAEPRVPDAELANVPDTEPDHAVVPDTVRDAAPVADTVPATETVTATDAATEPAAAFREPKAESRKPKAALPRWPTYALAAALAVIAIAVIAALIARKPHVARGPAIVRATKRTAVVARAAGQLRSIELARGARVEAGAIVAQLDETAQRAALDTAYRDFDMHLRAHLLDPDEPGAEAALREAATAVERARIALDERTLRSPVGGTASELLAQVGARIALGDVVAQIADPASELEIVAAIPAALRKGLAPGTHGELALGERKIEFAIARSSDPMSDADARRELGDVPLERDVVIVRGHMTSPPDPGLADGMVGTAELRLDDSHPLATPARPSGPVVEPIDVPPPLPPAPPRALAGVVGPPLAVAIAPKRSLTLLAIHVRPGERVAAGQVVAELDPKPLYDDIRAAETALAAAQTAKQQTDAAIADKRDTLDTVQKQVAAGSLAQSSLDAATSALLKAQAAAQQATDTIAAETAHLKQAHDHVADAQLRAPIDGTIIPASSISAAAAFPALASPLAAGASLARVRPDGGLRLRFAAPPSATPALGATIHVTIDGIAQPATATIRDIARGLDRASGLVFVEAEVDPSLAPQLKAGAAATIAP